jgi:hypothetical protein
MSMLVSAKIRQEDLVMSLERHEGTQPSQLLFSCIIATHIKCTHVPSSKT